MLFSAHHLVRPARFSPDHLAGSKFLPVTWMVAADRHPRHLARRRVDCVGKRSGKDDIFSGLGKNSVGIIEGRHGAPGIRKRQGASVGWDLKVESPGQGGSRMGVDVVVGASELDGTPAVL